MTDRRPTNYSGGPVVYFLAAPPLTPIKIGFASVNVAQRIDELQCGCPYRLKPIAFAYPGTVAFEHEIHRHFANERLTGEWFECSDKLRAFINALRRGANASDLLLKIRQHERAIANG